MPQILVPPAGAIHETALYCQEGTSDKVYQIGIYPLRAGYRVLAYNGRRGGTLTERDKTGAVPLNLNQASSVLQSLAHEKRRKGYVDGALIGAPHGDRRVWAAQPHRAPVMPDPLYIALYVLPADKDLILGYIVQDCATARQGLKTVKQTLHARGLAASSGGKLTTAYVTDMAARKKEDLQGLQGEDAGNGRAYQIGFLPQPVDWEKMENIARDEHLPFQDPEWLRASSQSSPPRRAAARAH